MDDEDSQVNDRYTENLFKAPIQRTSQSIKYKVICRGTDGRTVVALRLVQSTGGLKRKRRRDGRNRCMVA